MPQLFGPGGLYGGAERYATELSRAIARHTEVRLVGFGLRADWRHENSGLDVITLRNQLPEPRFATSPAAWGLVRHLRWADIVHCHQIYTMGTSLALLYTRARHKPIFVTDHAGGGLSLQSYLKLDAWFTGRLWVSRYSQQQHLARPNDRVVYGGVDAERFRPPEPTSTPAGRPRRALYVGRMLPVKGVEWLVQSLDPTTPCTLLGPEYDAAFSRRLRSLAQGKDIQFLPAVDGEALVSAYQNAACVVLPATELFSLAALEAMACATPVVGLSTGGSPEAIDDGVSGRVVPAGDGPALAASLRWFCEHPGEARRMGEAARQRVLDRFTWAQVAERCLQAYGLAPATSPLLSA